MHIGKLNSKEEVQIENLVSFIPFFISCLPRCSYLVSQFLKTEKCYHRTSIFLEFLLTRHPYWNLDSQKPEATLSSTLSSLPRHPLSRRILSRSSHPSAYRTLPGPRVHVLYGAGSGAPLQCSCLENPRDEPGGLLSMGLHRVRHHWSDLAAAATWSVLMPFHQG